MLFTDEELANKLNDRQLACHQRDMAEAVRVAIDEELKPELALRDGSADVPGYRAALVDTVRSGWDEQKLAQVFLLHGIPLTVLEECKTHTRSTSVKVTKRG